MSDGAPSYDPALVVGLGNAGAEYAGDRHNVGAMVVAELAGTLGQALKKHKARALVAEGRLGVRPGGAPGPRVIAAQPLGYMNEAGGPTSALASFYSLRPASVVVVHDELELPFGEVRLKRGGGEAGHNGLRSITSALKTRDYVRLRVGIGRPPGRTSPADFVLAPFKPAERKELPFILADAVDLLERLVTGQVDPAA